MKKINFNKIIRNKKKLKEECEINNNYNYNYILFSSKMILINSFNIFSFLFNYYNFVYLFFYFFILVNIVSFCFLRFSANKLNIKKNDYYKINQKILKTKTQKKNKFYLFLGFKLNEINQHTVFDYIHYLFTNIEINELYQMKKETIEHSISDLSTEEKLKITNIINDRMFIYNLKIEKINKNMAFFNSINKNEVNEDKPKKIVFKNKKNYILKLI